MKKLDVKKAKRAISKKMAQLETKFVNAKNELFQLQVFNEMEDLLDAEMLEWGEIAAQAEFENQKDREKFEKELITEQGKLNELLDMIKKHRDSLIPAAQQIYDAMKRSHLPVEKTKYITDHDN